MFSEPQVDVCFDEEYPFMEQDKVFAVEFLPGQFDQRANSLEECLQIISGGERPISLLISIFVLSLLLGEGRHEACPYIYLFINLY